MAGTVQILRNTPPPALLPGALSVELGTPTRLWVGAPGGVNKLLMSNAAVDAPTVAPFWVLKAGDTMTGPLVLSGPPTQPLHAATKAYADLKLPITGGTLTGPLILSGPPTSPLGAATKGYIDGAFLPLTGGTLIGPLVLRFADTGGYQALFAGTTRGMRFVTTAVGSAIEGVDQTGFGFYAPLTLGGSQVEFTNFGVVEGRFQNGSFTTYNAFGTQTGGFASDGWVLSSGGRRTVINDGNYGSMVDGAGRGALYLGGPGVDTNYYRNGVHRFENVNGSSLYARFVNPGELYLNGNAIYLSGATWPNGPHLRSDAASAWFRLGQSNGAFYVENSAARTVGGVGADGRLLSLDGRAVARNDGNYTVLQDGAGRDNIFLGANGNNHYRNATHLFESAFGGATYMSVGLGGTTVYGNLTATNSLLTNAGNVYGNGWGITGTGGLLNIGTGTTGNLSTLTLYADRVNVEGTINTNQTINTGQLNASGVFCNGYILATLATLSGGPIFAFSSVGGYRGHGFDRDGAGNPIVTLQTDCAFTFQTSTGNAWWGAAGIVWVMGTQCFNNVGPVGGHGSYFDLSDSRLKTDIEPAVAGLAEILKLKPMLFKRLSRANSSIFGEPPPPRQEMGFVAEDVAEALPIAVGEIELEDGPALTVSTTPILAAMVTALREIDQRLKTLEGA